MAIYMVMSGNIYGKLYQLKLKNIDCYVYCHIRFGANFNTQFVVPSIIL